MNRVLFLTGTCGSGKSTVAGILALGGWKRVSEDELWHERFGKNRGAFGTDEHRRKRREIQAEVLDRIVSGLSSGASVVVDATIHESPPEAYLEYRSLLDGLGIPWTLRVLHPRLDIAIARDAHRDDWRAGAARVSELRAKFTEAVFPSAWFLDTSGESPAETANRVLESGV